MTDSTSKMVSLTEQKLSEKQVGKIYFSVYRQMIKKFGHNTTTTTSELNNIGKSLFSNKFLGAFAQDQLPEKNENKPSKYAIINVDTQGLPGCHWVAVAGLPNSTKIMVFDSFGRASKTLLPTLRQKNGTDTDYDSEQHKAQLSCGQFSMAWLVFFDRYGSRNARLI